MLLYGAAVSRAAADLDAFDDVPAWAAFTFPAIDQQNAVVAPQCLRLLLQAPRVSKSPPFQISDRATQAVENPDLELLPDRFGEFLTLCADGEFSQAFDCGHRGFPIPMWRRISKLEIGFLSWSRERISRMRVCHIHQDKNHTDANPSGL